MSAEPSHCRSSWLRHISRGRSWGQYPGKLGRRKGSCGSIRVDKRHVLLFWAIVHQLFTTCCLGNSSPPKAKLFLMNLGTFLSWYLFPDLPWYFCMILCRFQQLVIGGVWEWNFRASTPSFSLPPGIPATQGISSSILRKAQVFNVTTYCRATKIHGNKSRFAQAATAKSHRRGVFETTEIYFVTVGGWKCKIKVSAGLVSS